MKFVNLPKSGPSPFLTKVYNIVDDRITDALVSRSSTNDSFIVWQHDEWARDILPKYFKHDNFQSFIRQLNTYGFHKVNPDRCEYANPLFLRGQRHLLENIERRTSKPHHQTPQQQQQMQSSLGPCVEVGKFRLEDQVEQLIWDNRVLTLESMGLRLQTIATEAESKLLRENLYQTEQKLKLLESFLPADDYNPMDRTLRHPSDEDTEEENEADRGLLENENDEQIVNCHQPADAHESAQAEPMHELSWVMDTKDNVFEGSILFPELEEAISEDNNVHHFLGETLTEDYRAERVNL